MGGKKSCPRLGLGLHAVQHNTQHTVQYGGRYQRKIIADTFFHEILSSGSIYQHNYHDVVESPRIDSVLLDGLIDGLLQVQAGGRSAGPAHMNSASSAKEAIRLMEADKERDRDRDASMRSASRDRDGRPRERGSDHGR